MNERDMNRRRFLELGMAGLGGAWVGLNAQTAAAMMGGGMSGSGGGMGMMGGNVPAVVDPAAGGPFADPPAAGNLADRPGVVEVSLDVGWSPVSLDGRQVSLLTYNGQFPGPTIRARQGDLLRVRFRNSLPVTGSTNMLGHERDFTNLHTHGLHVSPSGNSDNVHHQFLPGQTFLYEYDLSKQVPGALCLYHPHVHGSVAEQFWAGLVGAIVIEDPTPALTDYETHLIVLKDIGVQGGELEPYRPMDFMMGKEGALVTASGQVNPVLSMRPGQVQRWRILNASNARFYNLALENHAFQLIGTDGGLLDKPYPLPRVLLGPSERIDVLVQAAGTAGRSRLLSLPYSRSGMHGGWGGAQTVTLMTVDRRGAPVRNGLPATVNGEAKRVAMNFANLPFRRMTLGMHHMQGFINGRTFGNDTFTVKSRVGTYEIWEVVNASPMDHPFHQHVNEGQVLAISGGDPDYAALYSTIPAWKDTVLVPRMGSIRLLIPVMDYTGMCMMHCHILEHEDIGMMGMWEIG